MSYSSNIISGIQHLKLAKEYFDDFGRQYPGTIGDKLFKGYSGKIEWMFTDLKTNPALTDQIRAGIRKELESDLFCIPAVIEKYSLLHPEQKEIIEKIIDLVLSGEEVTVCQKDKDSQQ